MKKIFIAMMMCCLALAVNAQSRLTVAGTVIDENDEPLIGVSVVIKNQPGVGVKTDFDGKFKIQVDNGAFLIFTYVGYQKLEKQVLKSEKDITIKMKPDDKLLEEVTVFGQQAQKKVSVVGAISSIDVKELQAPATSINNMLGGRIPGVISMQSSGEPGKNVSNFWVRGIGTFGAGANPLILIDGLEGTLDQIDPADVENFSILKDASATAVYGVRGANGVILVTTRRGKEGKLSITARANLTVSQLKRLPNYLGAYDYAKLANEAKQLSGGQPLYDDLSMELIEHKLDPDLYPNVNWQKEILNPISLQQTYYINAQGGGSIAKYFVSVGYSNESAAYKQDKSSKYGNGLGYQKITYRSNIDMDLTKTTKLYFGTDGHVTINQTPGLVSTDLLWAMTRQLTPMLFPTRYSTGQLPTYGAGDIYSPYTMINETGYSSTTNYRNLVTLAISQDLGMITEGLSARLQVASDYSTKLVENRFLSPDMYKATGRFSNGQLQLARTINKRDVNYYRKIDQYRQYHLEANLNWTRDFGAHNVGALVYYYMQDRQSTFGILDMTGIGNIPIRYQGLSGRLTYGYDNTYFIDANFGYTGSANFPTGEQFGLFPSLAIGWVATEYEFMKDNLDWLSFLKFRFSYGMAGNDRISNSRFPYLTLVNNGAGTTWGYNGVGIAKTQIGARNLRWETSIKQNFGVDAKFFKDRLSITADFFRDIRDNIFQQRTTIPEWAGLITKPFGNVGSMYSYGTDGNIAYTHIINKDMDFTIRGNYTYAANFVKYYEEASQLYSYLESTGYPFGVQRGYISEGLFKDQHDIETSPVQTFGKYRPGDIKYKDINGDGVINPYDKVPLSYTNNQPRLMYGFGGEFRYKSFTAGVLMRGTGAVEYFRAGTGYDAGWIPFYQGELGNVLTVVNEQANRWIPAWYSGDPATENPDAMFPRLSYGSNENNSQLSTFWKEDGSYIRMQELSFGYKLTGYEFFKPIGVSSVDIQLVMNNLFTIDKVKYFDPEQAQFNGGRYPIPARYSLQLYVNF